MAAGWATPGLATAAWASAGWTGAAGAGAIGASGEQASAFGFSSGEVGVFSSAAPLATRDGAAIEASEVPKVIEFQLGKLTRVANA